MLEEPFTEARPPASTLNACSAEPSAPAGNHTMNLRKIRENKHRYLTWFWLINFPICIALYVWANEKIMGLYIALCSVYANAESSAAADEAKKAQDDDES